MKRPCALIVSTLIVLASTLAGSSHATTQAELACLGHYHDRASAAAGMRSEQAYYASQNCSYSAQDCQYHLEQLREIESKRADCLAKLDKNPKTATPAPPPKIKAPLNQPQAAADKPKPFDPGYDLEGLPALETKFNCKMAIYSAECMAIAKRKADLSGGISPSDTVDPQSLNSIAEVNRAEFKNHCDGENKGTQLCLALQERQFEFARGLKPQGGDRTSVQSKCMNYNEKLHQECVTVAPQTSHAPESGATTATMTYELEFTNTCDMTASIAADAVGATENITRGTGIGPFSSSTLVCQTYPGEPSSCSGFANPRVMSCH
ncbi:hypothetical protein BPNPMPFG_007868 (plasmid) [Mesorhizobium sp. AR07]|uniref:hypothetical protein n=1 Tax=Mesorhizobium sp. AR07 TaxID=2865838 RepID=UPI002160CE07|nr:hypothetical protein [Mesorhizobium sp. AR07]UVK48487.1 hypothetical protein BPNPMPFG_007868 [Mesorhizobium sp. AR07]